MASDKARKGSPKKTRASAEPRAGNPPPPSRLVGEQVLRDIHRVLQGRKFETLDDANEALQKLTGKGLKKASKKAPPLSPQQEAQDLAYRAMEAPNPGQAMALARQAIAKDADCVDALVTLATLSARSPKDLILDLEKAVAAGERSLGEKFFRENKGHFWGILETRPYMRARYELADLLLDAGRVSEAVRHFETLLELNPNDNQGVRDVLLGCYLAGDRLVGARRLLCEYKEDDSAVFNWGASLERILSGDFVGAARVLERARENNRFVELYLTAGRKLPPEMPDSYSYGSEEEAVVCIEMLGEAWAMHPEALLWLFAQVENGSGPNPAVQKKLIF